MTGGNTSGQGDNSISRKQRLGILPEPEIKLIRKYFSGNWRFSKSVFKVEQLPNYGTGEVSFAGRSNVGKSSLISAVTKARNLAFRSRRAGSTKALNLFECPGLGLTIVDFPGFGYSQSGERARLSLEDLQRNFLEQRGNLACVFLAIDARRGVGALDREYMDFLDHLPVSYQIVVTKSDKVGKKLPEIVAGFAKETAGRRAFLPEILPVSVKDDGSLQILRRRLLQLAGILDNETV